MNTMAKCIVCSLVLAPSPLIALLSTDPEDGLWLLQRNKSMAATVSLPAVKEVLSKPDSMYKNLHEQVNNLEGRLQELAGGAAKSVEKMKAKFEHNLTVQKDEIVAIAHANKALAHDIEQLRVSNQELHAKANKLKTVNEALMGDLKVLQENITIAQVFVEESLNKSTQLLSRAPELAVLSELAQEDEERSQQAAHAARLKAVAKSGMLQLTNDVFANGDSESGQKDASMLLKDMVGALTELQEQQTASMDALKLQFEKEYAQGAENRAKLLEKQDALTAKKLAELELQTRLETAVKHLEKVHTYLLGQVTNLRAYALRLSQHGKPAALLQTDAITNSLPDMHKVLDGPQSAYSAITGHVDALQARLADLNAKNVEDAHAQRKKYDMQLEELKHNISQQKASNVQLQSQIDGVDRDIEHLRHQATELIDKNDKMREDLAALESNLSIAEEVLHRTLEKTDEPLAKTKDLEVLHELDTIDAKRDAARAHDEELNQVSKARAALLQVEGSRSLHDQNNTDDILTTLQSSMNALVEEHIASQKSLKHQFEKEFQDGRDDLAKLTRKWGAMNETFTEKLELEQRLGKAVKHLEQTGQLLEKKRDSFMSFVGELTSRPHPLKQKQKQEVTVSKLSRAFGFVR